MKTDFAGHAARHGAKLPVTRAARRAARFCAAATALAAAMSAGALAAQAQPVQYLASNCANCHGTDGRSAGGDIPGLAGLSASDFVERMKAFRDGSRKATVMHQLAKGYTDEEIAALANWFAAQGASK